MVRRTRVDNGMDLNLDVLLPGRVARLTLAKGDYKGIYYNVHNFGLSTDDMDMIYFSIKSDIISANANPLK